MASIELANVRVPLLNAVLAQMAAGMARDAAALPTLPKRGECRRARIAPDRGLS
jgi:hypothetical protein